MALKIAHFPSVKTLEDFDFTFQPWMRELWTKQKKKAGLLGNAAKR